MALVFDVLNRISTKDRHHQEKLAPEEIYYPGRTVMWMGRYYRVQWCNGTSVGVSVVGSGPYQQFYEYLPQMWDWSKKVIPVGHLFLRAL